MTDYRRKIKKKDTTDTGPIFDRHFTGRRSLHNDRCIGRQSTDISGDYRSNVGQLSIDSRLSKFVDVKEEDIVQMVQRHFLCNQIATCQRDETSSINLAWLTYCTHPFFAVHTERDLYSIVRY